MNTLALLAVSTMLATSTVEAVASKKTEPAKNVVLVHGAFVDGSGWARVYKELRKRGYGVAVVQNQTSTLAADVAATKRAIAQFEGPVVLVGHSYGGAVITEAGTDPRVKALVYIAAFVPDAGESVQTLVAHPPAGSPAPPILPPQDGLLYLEKGGFRDAFSTDVDAAESQFMADSQQGWGVEAFAGAISVPAWRSKPSWFLVATEDRMIPPSAQREMASRAGASISEVKASHAVYVSSPAAVVKVVTAAATAE